MLLGLDGFIDVALPEVNGRERIKDGRVLAFLQLVGGMAACPPDRGRACRCRPSGQPGHAMPFSAIDSSFSRSIAWPALYAAS